MADFFGQYENEYSGGLDLWDEGAAGLILTEDYFSPAKVAPIVTKVFAKPSGYNIQSTSSNYNLAREGTDTTYSSPFSYLGDTVDPGPAYYLTQVYLEFDTSGIIGDISSVEFVAGRQEALLGDVNIDIRKYNWPAGVNWRPGSLLQNDQKLASGYLRRNVIEDVVVIPISGITKESVFKIVISDARQANNIAPTTQNYSRINENVSYLNITSSGIADAQQNSRRAVRSFYWL